MTSGRRSRRRPHLTGPADDGLARTRRLRDLRARRHSASATAWRIEHDAGTLSSWRSSGRSTARRVQSPDSPKRDRRRSVDHGPPIGVRRVRNRGGTLDKASRPQAAAHGAAFGQSPSAPTDLVRRRMSRTRQRDTPMELAVRSRLHRAGFRFRVNHRPLPELRRTADIAFPKTRIAIFLDGCFWHSCPIHATTPKSNTIWWRAKLDANYARDRDTDEKLGLAGWLVIRAWEHEPIDQVVGVISRAWHERQLALAPRPSLRGKEKQVSRHGHHVSRRAQVSGLTDPRDEDLGCPGRS